LTRGHAFYFDKFDDNDRFDKYDKLASHRVADASGRGPPFFQKEETTPYRKPSLPIPGIVRAQDEMWLGQQPPQTSTAKTA
jgi:hypothetical protein